MDPSRALSLVPEPVPAAPVRPRALKDLAAWERPREKLRHFGAEALGDRELLAVILGCGGGAHSVLQVAEELLQRSEGLAALADLGLGELIRVPGLGWAGASRIAALSEISRRIVRSRSRAGCLLDHPGAVYQLLRGRLATERCECVWVLLLDVRRRLIGERRVSVGSLMTAVLDPREVFRPAIGLAAAAVIVVHNHPSGDPSPSVEDHQVTARMAEAGRILGIQLVDHVVVAAEGYRSFREEGWLTD